MTGSFQTIVTHGLASGRSRRVWWSARPRRARSRPQCWHTVGRVHSPDVGSALLTDHYELTMLQAALQSGTAHRRSRLRALPATAARGPAVRRRRRRRTGAGRARTVHASTPRRWRRWTDVVDGPTLDWLASLPLLRRRLGLRRGRGLLPRSPRSWWSSRPSPRRCCSRPLLLSIYNHDSAVASAASRMTLAAGDRPCIEMGSRRTHEEAAVAAARAAYVAGLHRELQPRRPAAVRRADDRHQRAQLHAAARHRGRRLPRAGRRARQATPRCWSTPTTSPRRCAARSRSPGPSLGAVRLDSGDLAVLATRGARAARLARGDRDPDHRHQRPRRARDRGARRGTGRRVRRRHRSWSPAAGTRRAGSSTSWSRARVPTGELVSVAKKSDDKISVGGRKYALRRRTPSGMAEAEVIGIGHRPRRRRRRPGAAGAARARRRGGRPEPAGRRPRAARRSLAELPRAASDVARRAGDPDRPSMTATSSEA